MRFFPLLLPLFAATSLFALVQSIEHRGVKVTTTLPDKKKITYHVKRKIPDICKKVPINNEMLWTGNFANPKVPTVCKSTFVHTKGKLLPMHLEEGLETFGELEVLIFLKEMQKDKNMLLLDSRTKPWFDYMTIPGAVNMPFIYFKKHKEYEFHFEYALKYLGVKKDANGEYDFTEAKTLLLFCNGPWCTQSPEMIFALLKIGYPAEKLKWYRGGMQDWLGAGMTSTRK
ncbi:rhodanese-like domain-containing protein [Sulfurovum sp. NBC37-1]|uniref:rhodanese-like domain-containing protein n=1 Tax=Sulfurovum sp. (strain NBC37-1) TaxID=387093 RepID=UPI000158756D|nr:rhodanese-like domain-containing protein [Sulfurovum sp. NBC37-1]BAF72124.1 conserved hypothetical protein [Sulfurovum sp. NBC37-1]